MQRPKKFPITLLCFTLILAIIVTGITKPGFLLPLMTPHIPDPPTATYTEPEYVTPGGNSRAFRVQPADGVTIYAEENALDTDRTFNVTRFGQDLMEQIETKLYSYNEPDLNITPLCGWEVDAGMGPDDIMPGTFTMEFDLSRIGIPEDMMGLLQVFHVDENGVWNEFVTEIQDKMLRLESRQNELIIFGISIYSYILVTGGLIGINEFQSCSWLIGMSAYPVYEKQGEVYTGVNDLGQTVKWLRNRGKKIYNVRFYLSNELKAKQDKISAREAEVKMSVREEAKRQVIAENNGVFSVDKLEPRWIQLTAKKLADDPEYNQLVKTLYLDLESLSFTPNSLLKMADLCRTARSYLKDVAKIRMPTYVPEIYMKPNYAQPGVTVTTFPLGRAYCVIKTEGIDNSKKADDHILCTLTHELTHVSQREYCISTFSNVRFDEASAQLMEELAYKYYKDPARGIVTTEQDLGNGTEWQYLALEMDGYATKTWETSKSTEPKTKDFGGALGGIYKSERSDASYVYARFIEYLWRRVGSPEGEGTGITWNDLFYTYEKFLTHPSFSEMMIKAFSMTNLETLSSAYTHFAFKNRNVLLQEAIKSGDNLRWAYPTVGLSDRNGGATKLVNQDMTIKVRMFEPYVPEGYTKKIAMILEQDQGFAASVNSDVSFIKVGDAVAETCRYGTFYKPAPITTMLNSGLIEVDGVSRPKDSDDKLYGYKLWTMFAPDKVQPEKKNGQIRFRMPVASDVMKANLTDGFRVTITPSRGGPKKEFEWKPEIAGSYVSLLYSDILPKEFMEKVNKGEEETESINFTISVCEFFKDADGTKHFGPESEDSGISALLSEMGAHDGKLTITLHWYGPDDLDLHCTTPKGGHISYNNKRADDGYLDVDMNINGEREESIEHIYFDTPPVGDYSFYVHNYTDRTEGTVTAEVIVTVEDNEIIHDTASMGGQSPTWRFSVASSAGPREGEEFYIGSTLPPIPGSTDNAPME